MKKLHVAIVTGIFSVITGVCSSLITKQLTEQKMNNVIKNEVNIDNGNYLENIKIIVEENEKLKIENRKLVDESKNSEIDKESNVKDGEQEDENEPSITNLLDIEHSGQSNNSYFQVLEDMEGDWAKDISGTIHSNGMIYTREQGNGSYRIYKLKGEYKKIRGIISIPFLERDDTGKGVMKVTGDSNQELYCSKTVTIGGDEQKFEFDIRGVNNLKFTFIPDGDGRVSIGVYDIELIK